MGPEDGSGPQRAKIPALTHHQIVTAVARREGLDPDDREEYEAWVFGRAKAIRKERARANVAAAQEPKRNKVHWDHVLEEMDWLAKDFIR